MKNDGRLDRSYLKGAVGDAINVVMVAAGHNLRKILNKLRLLWLNVSKIKRVVDLVVFASTNLAKEAFKMSSVTKCAQELSSTREKKVAEISQINSEMSEQMVFFAEKAIAAANSIEEALQVVENGRNIINLRSG